MGFDFIVVGTNKFQVLMNSIVQNLNYLAFATTGICHNPMEGLESKFKPDTPELRDLNSAFFYESLVTCQIIHTQLSAVTKCIKNITIFLRTI